MRAGLIASTVGHVAVLLWGVIAFPDAKPYEVAPVDSLPVDLVPLSEVTKLRIGEKTAELREEEAPQPTETESPAPTPEAKTGEAKTEQPTPPTPEAKAQPAQAQPAPAPTPPPAPPEPKAAEPEAPPPEPVRKIEPRPAEEAPAEPAEAAPAPAPQQEKPKETTTVAEAAPTPVTATPKSKPAPPKRPRPQQTASNKEESDFNPNQIAALLNKVDPSGGGTQSSSKPASLGSARGQSNVQMSQSELDALRSQIAQCWNPPVGAEGASDLAVRLKVSLTPSGDVDAAPQVMNSSGNPLFGIASESARRAVLRCAPYSLPSAKYEAWREVIINFDPRELLGG